MAMFSADGVMDSGLNFLDGDCEALIVCSSQPANYADSFGSTNMLAGSSDRIGTIASSDLNIANSTRAGGGRKITTPMTSALTVIRAGSATHVAMVSKTSSGLLQVTTCSSVALTTADTVTVPAYRVEIADPTSDSEI